MKIHTCEIVSCAHSDFLHLLCVSFTTRDKTTWLIKSDLKIIWVIKFVIFTKHSQLLWSSNSVFWRLFLSLSLWSEKAKPLNSLWLRWLEKDKKNESGSGWYECWDPWKTSRLNARERSSMAAGRPTQWLLFPPPSHTLIQFVMDRRDAGRFNLSQKEALKWTSRLRGGGGLRSSRGCRTVTVKSGRCVWHVGASLPDHCCDDPVPKCLIANGQYGGK